MNNSFLTEMYKPSVTQEVLNEAACVVLAYCMTACFLTKNQGVTLRPSHFFRMLQYLNKSTVNFTNMESAHNTYDKITLHAPMSEETRNYIKSKLTDRKNIDFCMVRSILEFVNNNPNFASVVEKVTNNGVINRIVIDVNNISVDSPKATSVLIDNEYIKVFDSVLPIYDYRTGLGGIGQKELDKDYGFEAQRQFVLTNLGVDVGADSSLYYQTAHNNGSPTVASVESAVRGLYEDVCRRINEGLAGTHDTPLFDFRMHLIRQMMSCCYGIDVDNDNCTCLIVPSKRIDYKTFDVRTLVNKLYECDLIAKCPENLNPSVRIMDRKKELFQIRFKKEKYSGNTTGHRYKMYFKPSQLTEYFEQ